MSTLVTHHNGMDRVLKGVEFVVQGLYGSGRAARHARIGALHNSKVAKSESWFAGLKAEFARRRADREFEALMRTDPRIRVEFMAAKARAEWEV